MIELSSQDRQWLRELAHRQAEIAASPQTRAREARWYAHNARQPGSPIVIVEMETFERDMLPPLRCASPEARSIEAALLRRIVHYEWIPDDYVVPGTFDISAAISFIPFGLEVPRQFAEDADGRRIGYQSEYPIADLKDDYSKLGKSTWQWDGEKTERDVRLAEQAIGDILPVRVLNTALLWFPMLTHMVVNVMGTQTQMISMIDYPELFHEMMDRLTGDCIEFLHWNERMGLITLNNGDQGAGAGSYGFCRDLPKPGYAGKARLCDYYGNTNSQESVGLSPAMFRTFVYPYIKRVSGLFGKLYFGCCEPVHDLWEGALENLDGLDKISISPWCNEEAMGVRLADRGVIYSRKPSPNFIGVGRQFDRDGFAAHIRRTLDAAQGCTLEIICRDVYTVMGDKGRLATAVNMIRELAEKR